jgi:glycosyltransferase involved in cell wall biosynthesis
VTDIDVPDSDVVIATWWETAEWVHGLSITKGAKVYFIQGYEVFPFLPLERCKATYRLPMHKVVVAEWLRNILADEYGDRYVDVVPNSVDHTQFFAPVRCKQTIPTVGLLYSTGSTKRVDLSLEALKIVGQKYPGLRIVCFGSERPSQANKLPKGAEFFFNPPQDEIRNLYAQCDVWVTASKMEGFNLPAMEAMACRTPVVSTCAGWPAEAVQSGWNGVLLDVDVAKEEIAQAIEWVLFQPEREWMRLSLNAFQTVSESSWERSAGLFEKALLNAQKGAARSEIALGR